MNAALGYRANRWTLGVALASLAAVSGCGGGGSSGSSGSAAPAPTPTVAPAPTPTPSATPVLTQANTRIGACLNMGNHLEAPNEGDWGRAIAADDFTEIAARGFQTVRLPVRFSNHAATTPPYAIEPAFMARVEQVVDSARAAGLRVILDLHHYDDPQGSVFADPAGQTARLAGLWKQIAERFRSKDAQVWFELLNEPHDRLTHANLRTVLEPALSEVRATNPTRPVVIGGEAWSGIGSLATLPLPDDAYLVATFHYYDPFAFTHQGAPWVTPLQPAGRTFPSGTDSADLAANVRKAQDFIARTGRPLFLGEYGAYEGIPLAQRVTYYGAVHDAFAAAGVDGCAWAYTNTMPLRDPGTGAWIAQLLDAVGL
ncbi:MAG TPA: glycoside hydrolase family 5 protein [Croceibacterium sp.]